MIKVRFYFTSGKDMVVKYKPEIWEKHKKQLGTSWPNCANTDEKFGINFSQVTHYEVEE